MMNFFTTDEINAVSLKIKNGKAVGNDGILAEFLNNLGIRGKTWLTNRCTSIVNKCKIPKKWHDAKIIAILKPNLTSTLGAVGQFHCSQCSTRPLKDFFLVG